MRTILHALGAFGVMLGAALAVSVAYAQAPQTSPVDGISQSKEVRVIANLSIKNTQITPQDVIGGGKAFKISFEFENGSQVQTGVKYSVQLTRQEGTKQILADEMVYPESVSLSAFERVPVTIDYVAPAYLQGEHMIWIVARTEAGLVIGILPLTNVTLNGTGKYVEILSQTCYLHVEGENERYNLRQGVDISSSETLMMTCEAKNHFDDAVTADVRFAMYRRSVVGDVIRPSGSESPVRASFAPGERKVITAAIPKVSDPQSYDAVLYLMRNGVTASNTVRAHFVLQGQSATVQNIRLDKESYRKGETAEVSFYWSASADMFSESRSGGTEIPALLAKVSIADESGKSCSEATEGRVSGVAGEHKAQVFITKDCEKPVVTAELADASGNVFDSQAVSTGAEDAKGSFGSAKAMLSILILMIVIAGGLYVWDRRKGGALLFILAAIGAFALFGARDVSAAQTFVLDADALGVPDEIITTLSLRTGFAEQIGSYDGGEEKTVFTPGEQMVVVASTLLSVTCGNGGEYTMDYHFPGMNDWEYMYHDLAWDEWEGAGRNMNHNAPIAEGNYKVTFRLTYHHGGIDKVFYAEYPFTVSSSASGPEPAPPPASGGGGGTMVCDQDYTNNNGYGFTTNCTVPFTNTPYLIAASCPAGDFPNRIWKHYTFRGANFSDYVCFEGWNPGECTGGAGSACGGRGVDGYNRCYGRTLQGDGAGGGDYGTSVRYDLECFNTGAFGSATVTLLPPPPLSADLTANPSSGNRPLTTTLRVATGGTAVGPINYNLWWDCSNGSTVVGAVESACGDLPNPAAGACAFNASGMRCNQVATNPQTTNYTYNASGSYRPKVIVERGGNAVEDRADVTVNALATPNASCGTANKTYPFAAASFGSDTFCATGNVIGPIPSFPAAGSSASWTCGGSGFSPVGCTAVHQQNPRFDISVSPGIIKAKVSGVGTLSHSTSAAINITPLDGFNGSVTLTANLPIVGEVVIKPSVLNDPNYTSSMSVIIPGDTAVGAYIIPLRAVGSNGQVENVNVTLDVSLGGGGEN